MAVVLLAVGCGGARGAGPGTAHPAAGGGARADISPVRGDLEVYTDGKGHMVALVEPDPERQIPTDVALFYGDGKTMHAVSVSRFYADGLKFEIGFRDARIPAVPAGTVGRELGKVTISCWGTDVELTKLPAAESQAMVGAAEFLKNRTHFSPLALVRDGDRYLYVDTAVDSEKTYRVWSGTKGKMEQIAVEDAQYDERENQWSFKTKQGVLRGMRDPQQPNYTITLAWDGKPGAWASLERAENWKLIFEELGVYPDGRSPTPCDPMMAEDGRR